MATVTPAPGLNVQVQQIYPIVNSIFEQMTGTKEIQAVDTASLVSTGNTVISKGLSDLWLNTLARRIGYTIDSYRVYESKYIDLHRSQMEWGAYVQKLRAEMPESMEDKTYDVGQMDGQSVDQYIIKNPVVHQKFFEREAPYSFMLTMQRKLLKEAFLSEAAMAAFINMIFGAVQNKIAFVMEELGRMCVANYILNTGTHCHYHLVSMYNASHANAALTTQNALNDADFLRWSTGVINMIADDMTGMSVLYNTNKTQKFTPKGKQKAYMLTDYMSRLRTVVQYEAFNKSDVMTKANMTVPFWQAHTSMNDPDALTTKTQIQGTVEDPKTGAHVEKTLDNVLGIIFDYDAMGTFREEEDVLTTPVNARARYYNTFWFENQLWFNDLDENGVVFFLD